MPLRAARVLIPAALALGGVGAAFTRGFRLPFPAPHRMDVPPERAVETAALLSLGMRRVAADLGFLRLLQYYGTVPGEDQHDYLRNRGQEHPDYLAYESKPDDFPELKGRTLAILGLDPFYRSAVLYSAGALAFNIRRPDEAVELLERALERDPQHWRYHAYLAAIGHHAGARRQEAADALLPVALDPDSPALIKQVTAFMLKRLGRRADAARVYLLLLETTKDEGYQAQARRSLEELGALP